MWKQSKNKGFSLLELMVVISIISALASIAFPVFEDMKVRAKSMQGFTNGRVANVLLQTYDRENDGVIPLPFGGMMLTLNQFESENSCNTNNFLGFKLVNCMKVYHFYSMAKASIFAFEGWEGKGMGDTSEAAHSRITSQSKEEGNGAANNITCGDVWVFNSAVEYHFIDRAARDQNNCRGFITTIADVFLSGAGTIKDDWNLDGQINVSDFSSTFGMFPPFAESGLPPYYH